MKPKKHLGLTGLRTMLSSCFNKIPEHRQSTRVTHSIHDALMSGFACMHFQDPSLLQFQKRLEKKHHKSNLQTLFTITSIPESTQLRAITDDVDSEYFNTLKNQGYCIEHSYGHGDKNLCFNFYLLTLIAFAFHQVYELTDKLYQSCRQHFGSKKHLWENFRANLRTFVFVSWDYLLAFTLDPEKYITGELPAPS